MALAGIVPGCGAENGDSGQVADSGEAACDAILDIQGSASRIDTQDLESMRGGLPDVVAALDRLQAAAPDALRGDVETLAEQVDNWRDRIDDPDLRLDQDTFYRWDTPASIDAGSRIGLWASLNCVESVDARSATDRVIRLCLPESTDRDEVQSLFDRTKVPSATGQGFDLLDGIIGVASRIDGIMVTIDRFAAPERVDELMVLLQEPPVVATVEGDFDCP